MPRKNVMVMFSVSFVALSVLMTKSSLTVPPMEVDAAEMLFTVSVSIYASAQYDPAEPRSYVLFVLGMRSEPIVPLTLSTDVPLPRVMFPFERNEATVELSALSDETYRFVEVAFVVVAFVNVRSVPESVAMVAVVMFATVAVNVSMIPVVARASEEKKFVVVALVTVAFVPSRLSNTALVPRRFVAKKFVDVALVTVAFVPTNFGKVDPSVVDVAVKYGAVTAPLEVTPPTERDPAVTVPPTVRSFVIVDDAAVSEPVTVALPPTERSPVRVAFSPLSVPLKFELFVSNGVV